MSWYSGFGVRLRLPSVLPWYPLANEIWYFAFGRHALANFRAPSMASVPLEQKNT